MAEVQVTGTTFTARKEDDVHRANSEAIPSSASGDFNGLQLAGILVDRSQ
jgi:hypothetical protein